MLLINFEFYLMRLFFLLLFLAITIHSFAQNGLNSGKPVIIEGSIIDKMTNEPLPYATIINKNTKKGTISNVNGYFKLKIENPLDRISISYIGYKPYVLKSVTAKNYIIHLEENVQKLNEFKITPSDDSYLFDIFYECKKNKSQEIRTGKAFYELKTTIDENLVEIVESFNNADVSGYDLKNIDLKTGRLGLQFYKNRTFISTESSRAIRSMENFKENEFFPTSPYQLSKKSLKKHYYIELDKAYKNEVKDSIYVLKLTPKDSVLRSFFNCTAWLSLTNKSIIKLNLVVKNAKKHPFLSLYSTDSLKKVNLNITKSFIKIEESSFFEHVDFNYEVAYKNREGEIYTIKTDAVLHIYDFDSTFELPLFSFSNKDIGDYRKINALPPNHFFWKNNDELKLYHKENVNYRFFNNPKTLTVKNSFSATQHIKKGFFEHPFIKWSRKRILFKENDTSKIDNKISTYLSDHYDLSVKLFLDVNNYTDSFDILTATILDPYQSFYYLPVTPQSNCFINLYFDIVEIERRNLLTDLKKINKEYASIKQLHTTYIKKINDIKNNYFKEVERGSNFENLKKWNSYVLNNLGIDNMALFMITEH